MTPLWLRRWARLSEKAGRQGGVACSVGWLAGLVAGSVGRLTRRDGWQCGEAGQVGWLEGDGSLE